MSKDIEKDYWKYYVRLPYESPVYKVVEDKKGSKKKADK